MCLKRANKPEAISEFCQAYTLKRIAKKEKLYFLMLRGIKEYFFSQYDQYLLRLGRDDIFYPSIEHIEKYVKECDDDKYLRRIFKED